MALVVSLGVAFALPRTSGPDQKPLFDPATLLAAVLALVTAYYAWQNHVMATAMREQLAAVRIADVARQREVHVLDVDPLIPDPPNILA